MALGRIDAARPTYYALNLVGIGLALLSHLVSFNPASLVIQSFVFAISGLGVLRHLAGGSRADDPL